MASSLIKQVMYGDLVSQEFKSVAHTVSAGTVGSIPGGTSETINVAKTGYTPIAAHISKNAHATNILAHVTLTGNTLYLRFVRTSSSAYDMPADDVRVTVLYKKN